ncbi:MAG: hypothetical protein J6C93_03270 [Clostridia bacterium]|nr:hypothetical protein [Clostridia bacterium]
MISALLEVVALIGIIAFTWFLLWKIFFGIINKTTKNHDTHASRKKKDDE